MRTTSLISLIMVACWSIAGQTTRILNRKSVNYPFLSLSSLNLLVFLVLFCPLSALFAQNNNWMAKNASYLNNKTLREIIWPGSHDAGTGVFLKPYKVADESGETDVTTRLYNAMKGVVGPINERIEMMAKTQVNSIYSQLNSGARYFDLRPYWNNGEVCNSHTLLVERMDQVFKDVNSFLDKNPNELIILHERQEGGFNTSAYQMYWKLVMEKIGSRLVENTFSAASTYASVIKSGRRIIYMTAYSRPADKYLWNSSKAGGAFWPGTGITGNDLFNKLKGNFSSNARNKNTFVISSLAYSPVWTEYTASVTIGGTLKEYHNKHIKNQIVGWMDTWYSSTGQGMNILMTDFIEENPAFVNKVIELNRKASASGPVAFNFNFKNTAPYDTWFEVTYILAGKTQKWNTGTLGNGGSKIFSASSDNLQIVSVQAQYKDGLTWKIINTVTYNKPAKDIPKNFSLSGVLLQRPKFSIN